MSNTPSPTKPPRFYALRGLGHALRWTGTNLGWVLAWIFMPFVLALYGLRKLGGKFARQAYGSGPPAENRDFPYRFMKNAADNEEVAGIGFIFSGLLWLFLIVGIVVAVCGPSPGRG